uniref:Electron carrier n=1 Tax=Rhizophora mucronata TaxID=61149 RepID=A0A2P2LJE0_RHIMU
MTLIINVECHQYFAVSCLEYVKLSSSFVFFGESNAGGHPATTGMERA